jgi:outer membrane protein, heavy metal efflux system
MKTVGLMGPRVAPLERSGRARLLARAVGALFLLPALTGGPALGQPDGAAAADTSEARGNEIAAPSVDELVRDALARSPSVGALRARLEAARQMARVPGLPNPVLELMTQDAGFPSWTVGTMEMSMVQVGVTQSFPPLGRIGAQRAIGRAEADERDAELQAAQRQVVSQVRVLYGRLYALDREREALDSGSVLLESLARAAMDRYSANRTEQEAVLKAQLSSSRLNERRNDLETERASTAAALNQLLDRPGGGAIGRVSSIPEVQAPDSGWDAIAVSHSAEVQTRRAAVIAAQRRVQLARTGYRPELMVGGDVGLRGRLHPVVGFRIGIGLPLWESRRARFEVQAAEAELRMAREEQREAEAMARATAARLGAEWRRSTEQLRLYREALVPQTQAALDAARSSFLTDRVDFSTVIEDFQMWLEARSQLTAREAERFGTWAELQSLISPLSPDQRGSEER